jgi:hypothetical protein
VKSSRHLFGLVFLTSVLSFFALEPVSAQSALLDANRKLRSNGNPALPPGARGPRKISVDAVAAIDLGTAQPVTIVCRNGSFERVGLRHDQIVDIAVQYSTANPGQAVSVEALDGGQVIATAKDLVVAADGTIRFRFRAGHQPGVYQVALHYGAQELGLHFWVLDDEHPKNNPAVVNSGS